MAEKFIQGAIKHPGALTAQAKKEHESPMEFAREHEHSKGKTGQRARLAMTLKGMHHNPGHAAKHHALMSKHGSY